MHISKYLHHGASSCGHLPHGKTFYDPPKISFKVSAVNFILHQSVSLRDVEDAERRENYTFEALDEKLGLCDWKVKRKLLHEMMQQIVEV